MLEPNTNTKTPSTEIDAEKIARLLELELMMKRVEWKKAKAKHRSFRAAIFSFLFLLVAGCVVAFLFLFSKAQERRLSPRTSPTETAEPAKR